MLSLFNSDSADKVVLHTGKYEELIVYSHEIAASTAQLVAASKVSLLYHNIMSYELQISKFLSFQFRFELPMGYMFNSFQMSTHVHAQYAFGCFPL